MNLREYQEACARSLNAARHALAEELASAIERSGPPASEAAYWSLREWLRLIRLKHEREIDDWSRRLLMAVTMQERAEGFLVLLPACPGDAHLARELCEAVRREEQKSDKQSDSAV